ncbi:hypothetical protein M9Y10_029237 [Tritrichomonas musculus]|uniref:Uncharacterized protein n=1 Tax=Tritrichomonas musculus TaxID=1915356 RepID=A0ABR2KLM5_9EUKA
MASKPFILTDKIISCSTNKKKHIHISNTRLKYISDTLFQHFSSGVRLQELISIATILSFKIPLLRSPDRDEKRSYKALLIWFYNYWSLISPILPMIHLRDENNMVINGQRELLEMILK